MVLSLGIEPRLAEPLCLKCTRWIRLWQRTLGVELEWRLEGRALGENPVVQVAVACGCPRRGLGEVRCCRSPAGPFEVTTRLASPPCNDAGEAKEAARPRGRGGHVFVVHGRIESVVHDYALIPTSSSFSVRGYWKPVLRGSPEALKPRGWPRSGYAQARGRKDIWFINVGGRYSAGISAIVDRAVRALGEIAAGRPTPGRNRTKPVVALPVLGIAGGGLGSERGEVLRTLLAGMAKAAEDLDLDIAVVTPDASVYGAAQHVRRVTGTWPLPDEQLREARVLGELARKGDLALFMGAGVSIPAGLPTWGQLLEKLAKAGRIPIDEGFRRLTALDQAQYLSAERDGIGKALASIISAARVPSLSHTFLASLGCREAVTTNYDRLYEKAVRMQRGRGNVATIMPWEPPQAGKPWILKMHGDVKDPGSIVLTRQQFVRYDAETRPAGSIAADLVADSTRPLRGRLPQ